MNNIKYLVAVLICFISFLEAQAHINPDLHQKRTNPHASFRMDCARSTAQEDQDINNVRARLQVGGDVWWNGDDGLYIVPKVPDGVDPVSSIFAGAVWIGGVDPAGNLKIAAQTFGRSSGDSDFFPGPLDPETGTVDQETCADWDKMFEVLGENIDVHVSAFEAALAEASESCPDCTEAELNELAAELFDASVITEDIRGWPARGNKDFFSIHNFELPNTSQGLGAFWDQNGDGIYEPETGDYPIIEIRGCTEPQYPDQMYFWIYNDAGGVHTETNADAIQMEIQVQAFAYATNDQLNDMTFQRYKLINRAVETIDSTYFAMWVDPDLGCYLDDYVGCDVDRSLMYVYNEDALDGEAGSCNCPQGVNTYCDEVPILGVDYFRGPLGPKLIDTLSVPGDTIFTNPPLGVFPDTIIELGMSSFVYYNNGATGTPLPGTTDPQTGTEYYNYLTGTWRDGTPFTDGGNGYGGIMSVNYVFPNPPNDINGWSMAQEGLGFGDRRTVQASGPLRLDPGAVNELIIGVPWVPNVDHPEPDISALLNADGLAQSLFDNCFDITDGPDAPDLCTIELDQELIFTLSNELNSNNFNESYEEKDLQAPEGVDDLYVFQGYKVFQLVSPTVTVGELNDPSRAQIVYQVDIKDGVSEIYNWTSQPNPDPNAGIGDIPNNVWTPNLRVEGNDEGVRHTFRITQDRFATSDTRLINHKKYYFLTIAYAYNNYSQFNPTTEIGQRNSYLEGRRNIQTYTVIPRPINDRELNTFYGDGAIVTRLDGSGTGENFLEIDYSETDLDAILNDYEEGNFDGKITYQPGAAPIEVKVYDPRNVKDGTFTLQMSQGSTIGVGIDELDGRNTWTLTKNDDPDFEVMSEIDISRLNEQLIVDHGFSITLGQSNEAGDLIDPTTGAIGQTVEYEDPNGEDWFNWIPDDAQIFGGGLFNYIPNGNGELYSDLDPTASLSNIGTRTFSPFALTEYRTSTQVITPGWVNTLAGTLQNPLDSLNNVDIVLTSDKSKWSRCIVVETASPSYYDSNINPGAIPTVGDAQNLDLRESPSVGRFDNDGDGLADEDGGMTGMGWFPGYAIDVETGKRLNIFFGENSTFRCDPDLGLDLFCDPDDNTVGKYDNFVATGADMMWNPTSQLFLDTGAGGFGPYNALVGAQHYIYVTDTEYDECAEIRETITNNLPILRRDAYQSIKWAGIPIVNVESELDELGSGDTGLIPNDVTIKLRVDSPYSIAKDEGSGSNNFYPAYEFSLTGKTADPNSTQADYDEQLDAINVVPNPYYGYSSYEISQFSNVVKITNLPAKCTVTIYSLDGQFIRQYRRDEVEMNKGLSNGGVISGQINPAIEWDLRNKSAIPVASGVYLIHIDAGELGERVVKWFGVARQFDPSGL